MHRHAVRRSILTAAAFAFAAALSQAQTAAPTATSTPSAKALLGAAKDRVKASATKVSSTEGGAAAVAVGSSLAAPVTAAASEKAAAVKEKTKAKAATAKTAAKAKATTAHAKAKTAVQKAADKSETARTTAKAAAQLLNINTAPLDKLEALPGVGDKYAQAIVDGRPYQATDDLAKKKIVPDSVYNKISKLVSVK